MSRRIIYILVALTGLVSCNKFTSYDGPYFLYFDSEKSSSTSINEFGELVGNYYLHYSGVQRSDIMTVKYEVVAGNGLVEGVDYEFESFKGSVIFYPDVYEMTIRIRFLKHEIDAARNNSLRLSLVTCSDPAVSLGYPGPLETGKTLIINKYKNE